MSKKNNYLLPIIVSFFLFAMISFVTGFQNPFGVILKEQLSLSNLQSQLGNFANFIAYAFMGIPAGIILQKKGYKFSAIAAVIVGLAGVALMFVSSMFADANTIFAIYLSGAFVAGFSMCMLNTVVNPMLNTLGGGGRRGNQLLQFGGASNSLAATICPVLVGYLMGSNLRGVSLVDARPALYIAMGIFLLALIVLILSKLPEPTLEAGARDEQPKITGALKFRHFVLGVLAIFLYVGVEVGIPNMANLYMTTATQTEAKATVDEYNRQQADAAYLAECQAADKAGADTDGYQPRVVTEAEMAKAVEIQDGNLPSGLGVAAGVAGSMVGMYWFLMLIGRLGGGALGGMLSSRVMLGSVSALAVAFMLLAMLMSPEIMVSMPGFKDMSFSMHKLPVNILFLILCGLCTSVMWGGIFNLAVEGVGKYTAVASGLFMMMVCGGGVLPLIQGAVADGFGYLVSYIVPFAGVVYILLYSLFLSRPAKSVKTNV